MKWSVNNKSDIKNIDQVNSNKYILNLSQRDHTPSPTDEAWDNYDTQDIEVHITGLPTTSRIKEELIKLQNEYDLSEEVNSFTINGITGWIDRNTRIALKNSIEVMEAHEENTYTVWLNGIQMTFPISIIRNFLDSLEIYAINSFNVTQQHLADIANIDSRDDLFTYDISAGYPEKINLNI